MTNPCQQCLVTLCFPVTLLGPLTSSSISSLSSSLKTSSLSLSHHHPQHHHHHGNHHRHSAIIIIIINHHRRQHTALVINLFENPQITFKQHAQYIRAIITHNIFRQENQATHWTNKYSPLKQYIQWKFKVVSKGSFRVTTVMSNTTLDKKSSQAVDINTKALVLLYNVLKAVFSWSHSLV